MFSKSNAHVFIIDDDVKILDVIKNTLEDFHVKVACFNDGQTCLKELCLTNCDLLITDVNMPKMNGLELLAKVKHVRPLLPVLVITGYGDVPTAVKAMKLGAADFVEKPLDEEILLMAIEKVLDRKDIEPYEGQLLTSREKEVLRLILAGKGNKEIADVLHRSVKTIEFHRYHLMHKLGAHNLADLIRTAGTIDLES